METCFSDSGICVENNRLSLVEVAHEFKQVSRGMW